MNFYIPLLLFLFAPVSHAAAYKYLYQEPQLCEFLLTTDDVRLSDMIAADLVEPEGQFLYTPSGNVSDHELKTARLLAERLKRPLALLPRLNKTVDVPAVDGVMFNDDGDPVRNFSLKTFMPSQGSQVDLNQKLLATMRVARRSVEKNYNAVRWNEIIPRYLPRSISREDCGLECATHAKIFGVSAQQLRPVTIVIDYTLDHTAVFRLHMRLNGTAPHVYLTLNSYDQGINLLHLMERMRAHPTIKEYVFLGAHHLLSVTETGYQMTEFCDTYGHKH